MTGKRALLYSVLGWALFAFAVPPVGFVPFALFGLVPWILTFETAPSRGFKRRFLLGMSLYGAYHLQWVGAITGFAGPAALLVLALIYFGFQIPVAYLLRWAILEKRARPFWALPLFLTLNDILREAAIGGICWHTAGMAFAPWNTFIQGMSWVRVWPFTFFAYAANAFVAAVLVAWRRGEFGVERARLFRAALGLCGFVLAALAVGFYEIQEARSELRPGPTLIGLQGNVAQGDKMKTPENAENPHHLRYLDLAREGLKAHPDAALVIWPETSIRPSIHDSERPKEWHGFPLRYWLDGPRPGSQRSLASQLAEVDPKPAARRLWIGGVIYRDDMPSGDYDEWGKGIRERNAALLLETGGGRLRVVDRYFKRKLVPLGEYIPLRGLIPGRDRLKAAIDDAVGFVPAMTAGEAAGLWSLKDGDGGHKFGINICFEIAYPEIFREARRSGAEFVVNISNDAWYGTSSEMDLVHLHTMVRAIESRTSIFRVSNTGITTLIDPLGREVATVEAGGERKEVAGVLAAAVPIGRSVSFYVRMGDLGGAAFGLFAGLYGLWLRRCRDSRRDEIRRS